MGKHCGRWIFHEDMMHVGIMTIEIHLEGCSSLKEKRSRLKPLIARLHREFNISVAEMDNQDAWKSAVVACAMVNSDVTQIQRSLQQVLDWIELNWQDLSVVDDKLEII
jgi:uncharacterized protein YlxP (DUF503 family)